MALALAMLSRLYATLKKKMTEWSKSKHATYLGLSSEDGVNTLFTFFGIFRRTFIILYMRRNKSLLIFYYLNTLDSNSYMK